ncbi:MAG: extracellular solute-binding protein [Kiritimatiellia bacterium]
MVTAADVKWTFDTIMDPGNPTGPHKIILGKFHSPEIISRRTIRFQAEKVHWMNLVALSGFEIMPKHAYEKSDFSKLDFRNPVVSGPYTVDRIREQVETRMKRRNDWWAADRKSNQNIWNFDYISFRYFTSQENAFEAFKKGQVDVHAIYTARLWMRESAGEKFIRNWIVRQRIKNHKPVGYQGFALNTRRFPFDDVRVRKALAHLVDRKTMNRTMMFNAYFLHRSFFEDLYKEGECTNTFYEFNIDKARRLLKEAGFRINPETGYLNKNGRELAFEFLMRSSSSEKFLVLLNNALKEAGIRMTLVRKDMAAWVRDMDSYNFDATWAAWGAGIHRDPEQTWLSSEADRPSGNNYTGFKNDKVDALIEKQKTNFNLQERNEICRKIDKILMDEVPYVLLWNIDATRLFYWNKFGTPKTVLSKFGDERSLISYWWFDRQSESELQYAMENKENLPARPKLIIFDETLGQEKLN